MKSLWNQSPDRRESFPDFVDSFSVNQDVSFERSHGFSSIDPISVSRG